MEDTAFDRALVAAVFEQAALTGWRGLSVVDAARASDLPLDRARARCPGPAAALMRFGLIADQAALAEASTEGAPRDQLFDLIMRRIDVLQQHRAGMLALFRYLPTDPPLALALSAATGRSMGWVLEAAGLSASGLTGRLRVAGLVGVWLYTLRAWKDDESADLSGTMAALDKALDQAEKWAASLPGGKTEAAPPPDAEADGPDVLITANPPPPPPAPPPPSPPSI